MGWETSEYRKRGEPTFNVNIEGVTTKIRMALLP